MAKKMKKPAKKAPARAAAPAPKPVKITAASKPRTKSEIYRIIAESTGISRKQVVGVFDTMARMMAADLAKPSPDRPKVFTVPGLMKVTARFKPAVPAREGKNPFTGETMMFKAKPASTSLKIRPLRQLKQMV
jgi:nucleoid DNA-binding protein